MKTENLSVLLCFLATGITLAVAQLVYLGVWPAVQSIAVIVVALVGYGRWKGSGSIDCSLPLSQFLLSIVFLLLLNAARYAGNFMQLSMMLSGYSTNGTAIPDQSFWFAWRVCLPVSILLFGGYLICRCYSAGCLMTWCGFSYCVTEAIIQFIVEFCRFSEYDHKCFIGVIVATALFCVSVSGIRKLVHPKRTECEIVMPLPPTLRQKNIRTAFILLFILAYASILFFQAGFLPVGVIVGSMMIGMVAWRKTTCNAPADPNRIVPLYLLIQILFFIHVGEESLTHFNNSIVNLTDHSWSDVDFYFTIALLGPAVWVYGAYSLWHRRIFGNYILWFMIIGMILGEPTHILVFPIVKMARFGGEYAYFSGMHTALFPMIPAIVALSVLRSTYKESCHV